MLMPLPNVALMSVAPNDSILMQFDIRVDARWEGYCHRQTGLTVAAFLVCQCAHELTRFGGLLVVRQFRDEHNGALSWAHGFPNGYAGLLNHDLPKFIQVSERFASLGRNGNHEGASHPIKCDCVARSFFNLPAKLCLTNDFHRRDRLTLP
jgi:hypothetical protein